MHILVLSPYPPYPPHGGGTMRIFQLVRGLAANHTVTCLTFAPDAAAEAALTPLETFCRVVAVRGPQHRSGIQRAWTTVASPLPDMALRNQSAAFATTMQRLLDETPFDVVQAESIEMAPFLAHAAQSRHHPLLVFDQFNAEFVLQKRAALTSIAALQQGRITPRHAAGAVYSSAQWVKLAHFERFVMRACDRVIAVSEDDRRTMLALDASLSIGVVPNGVDTRVFSRTALQRDRVGPICFDGRTIVFSGTLDFRPNVDAVLWFAHNVLPLIRAVLPTAQLVIVGKRPTAAIRALASPSIIVVGEVSDARPYLAAADAYVVPMRIGGGVRLKLLEALSLEAPVISTSMGAEGVEGLSDGQHCLIANNPASFAEATLRLLDEPALGARLGAAGRDLVVGAYDWASIVPRLEHLYQTPHR